MRKPRYIEPRSVYHLISRFVDREWYITCERERRLYLQLLGTAVARSDWRCLTFAVMSNHIHLLLVAGVQTLASWLRRVHSPFANVMNRSYDRIGSMFQRGPKSLLTTPESVARVMAYIHNNPVRAKCVAVPADTTWTSHRAYVRQRRAPSWLHVSEGLARAGFKDGLEFDRWVADPERAEFDAAYEQQIAEPLPLAQVERHALVDPKSIVVTAAREIGISVTQLTSRRRSSTELLARQVVVYCAESLGLPGVDVARALCVTQQAVSLIRCRGIEPDARTIGARVLGRIA